MGASNGIGLACLKLTLAAGHQCVALCRDPSKLAAILPPESNTSLRLIKGNAHDIDTVSQLLKKDDGTLVDILVSTIGNKPSLSGHASSDPSEYITLFYFPVTPQSLPSSKQAVNNEPEVCGKGMATLLEALARVRKEGATGRPYIIACSTTSMSKFGRDIPLPMVPLYNIMLKTPREDKMVMEAKLTESGEDYTVVQPSLLVNGESKKPIRVGIEDLKTGPETKAIGYTISREDAGRWVAENLVLARNPRYLNKIAKLTY